ncbi:phospholipase D-like domain-containing protein [Actinoplanes sp. NPDC049802]|uniref:phospholipase D-like domain-containing protein n=1 Tax=Actinoplanes sp. NPDC049802 TaxID=3154742 RepID=UPI0033D95B7F
MADELDLGALRSPDGFYLRTGASFTPFTAGGAEDPVYRHRFTYRESENLLKHAAIDLIKSARHRIFMASYRIGDHDLLNALFEAANRLCGGVYIITSWTETTLRRDLAGAEDMDGVDLQAQNKRFDELTRRGIALRGHEQCHAKFLVVDDDAALVSSANLETSALADRPGRGATGENGVVVTDKAEVDRLSRFFTRLWYAGCTWEALPGEEYALHHRKPVPCPVAVPPPAEGPGVIWTDGDHREYSILAALHDVIGRARRELVLATFSLTGIRDRPDLLLDPLRIAMTNHDLDVRLLVRSRNNVAAHRADTAALAALGVTVYADSLTHAKGVIADSRYGALFSANFDAQHGLFDGVEVGVRLDESSALAEAERFFDHAMTNADMRFVPHPTQAELDRGLAARWQRPWPHGQRLVVQTDDSTWHRLTESAMTGPVLWEESPELRLYLANLAVTLIPVVQGGYRLVVEASSTSATARLESWYRATSSPGIGPRGCCPAVLVRAEDDQ